jgi:hypothetical protein
VKRTLIPLAVLSVVLGGCGDPTATVSPAGIAYPGSPTPTGPPGDATAITCDDVSFVLDPTLASGFACEIVPGVGTDFPGYPRYVRIGLEGYPLSDASWDPEISIYPVAEFAAMVDDVPEMVANLEASTIGGSPVPNEWGQLPFLYNPDQGEFFYAQFEVVPFESGTGIRYLTGFTQDMGVFDNPVLYTYQATTDDGRYWISAVFPINHPILPTDAGWPPNGMTEEEWSADYDTYVSDNVNQLNAQPPSSFTPSIDDLDALIASITIAP